MKIQTKVTTSIIFLIASFIANAQDTIYFNDATIVCAKIHEVGISEIKCQRFDNLNGPTYVVQKKDINRIKYSNGSIDTISTFNSNLKEVAHINMGLQLVGTKLYYDGKRLGQAKTHHLLMSNTLSKNQINFIKDVKEFELYDRNKKALAPALFVLGILVPAVTSLASVGMSLNGDQGAGTVFIAGVAVGAALRISGHVVFAKSKNKANAKKLEILKKYNQNEMIY